MTTQQARLQGQTVFDSTGQRIGEIQRVFYDQASDEPAWITVRGPGMREAFVPMAASRLDPSGLTVAVRKDVIQAAPAIAVGTELSASDAARLNRYYSGMLSALPETPPAPSPPSTEAGQASELTTYEERVRVGTEPIEDGRVRMHKSVESEPVEKSVPVRHEEVRVERAPATSQTPTPEHRFEEESVDITLHDERPTIVKETVPVETVRLATKTETDERRVTDEVRRERIDVEDQRSESQRR